MTNPIINLTEKAKQHLINVSAGNFVTLSVKSGGCNGFQYKWGLQERKEIDKTEWSGPYEEVLLLDVASEFFVFGSTVDYVGDFANQYLSVKNPVAKSSCGCGESFGA